MEVLSRWHLPSNLKTQNTTYSHLRMELFLLTVAAKDLLCFLILLKIFQLKGKKDHVRVYMAERPDKGVRALE